MKQLGWTSIVQSKKLIEAGLDPNTADMGYVGSINAELSLACYIDVKERFKDKKSDFFKVTPCWSLGALIELLPPYLFEFERGIDLNIYRNLNGKGWHVSYMPNNIFDLQKDKFRQISNGDSTVETTVNMIIWLLENGHIKKGV